jgi:hypothetical protein
MSSAAIAGNNATSIDSRGKTFYSYFIWYKLSTCPVTVCFRKLIFYFEHTVESKYNKHAGDQ